MRKTTHWALLFPLIVVACSSNTTSAAKPISDAALGVTTSTQSTGAGQVVNLSMSEWAIDGPKSIKAGSTTFNVTNKGTLKHELVLARGDSYKALPQEANGHILEDSIAESDKPGEAGEVLVGETKSVTLDLKPGKYVLFCNLVVGSLGHAAKGQILEVTVG